MKSIRGRLKFAAVALCGIALAGCDAIKNVETEDFGDSPTPNVVLRGTVSGLTSSPVGLNANFVAASGYVGNLPQGNIARTVAADGSVSFGVVPQGSQYTVTVTSVPIGKLCTVTNGNGTAVSNITNVVVACAPDPNAPTYVVSGTVVGLGATAAGLQLTLTSTTGEETVDVPAGGTSFAFTSELLTDFDYEVTVETRPQVPGAGGAPPTVHECAINNGSGTVVNFDIADVEVVCGFEVGGRVYAMGFPAPSLAGLTLAMERPGGLDSISDANLVAGGGFGAPSTFTFPTLVPSHAAARYKLSITAQPAGTSCVVGNGGYVSVTTPADVPTGVLLLCSAVPAAPIAGTYRNSARTFVTFFANGTYLAGTHGATAGESGTEHGLYAPGGFGPGTLVFYAATDSSGAAGLTSPTSGAGFGWPFGYLSVAAFATVPGPPAQITGTGFTLTAVDSSAGPLGGWTSANGLSALVYETAGAVNTATYYSVDNLFGNAFGQAPPPQFEDLCLTGIDTAATNGTYTQDRSAGCLPGGLAVIDLPDPATSTDIWAATYGQPGPPAFGQPAGTVTYTVTGDSLSLAVPGPPPAAFSRSIP